MKPLTSSAALVVVVGLAHGNEAVFRADAGWIAEGFLYRNFPSLYPPAFDGLCEPV